MKRRNPLFVAGFPYITIFLGYIIFLASGVEGDAEEFTNAQGLAFLIFMVLALAGTFYIIYWLVITARVLRRETSAKIPTAFLLIIPLANYWWMWRYSQAAEIYTHGKQQAALIFVLIAALGSIGMGITQDTYNKTMSESPAPPPEQ